MQIPHRADLDSFTACAIHENEHAVVVEQARKLINAHQFNNEPLRVLLASLGSGLRATDGFLVSTLSKHLLRETRLAHAAVNQPDVLRYNTTLNRWGLPGTSGKTEGDDAGEDEEDDGPVPAEPAKEREKLPMKNNPVNVAVYGQILLAAKSYQSAICTCLVRMAGHVLIVGTVYLLHAYDYAPDDPLICLTLAIASVGRAMQRQSDNRHHLITQVCGPG